MQPLKRIIYNLEVILKTVNNGEKMYHVSYHYFVQAVEQHAHVTLSDQLYDRVKCNDEAMRYLDVVSCDEIDPEDSDYYLYDYLYHHQEVMEFYVKDMVVYKLDEVLY